MICRRGSAFLLALAACLAMANADAAPMTNDDVIKLSKSGFDDSLIIEAISRSEPQFDLSAAGLLALKEAGLSNTVIAKMLTATTPPADRPATKREAGKPAVCDEVASGQIRITTKDRELLQGYKNGRKETESSGAGRAIASVFTFGIVGFHKTTHYALLSGDSATARFTQPDVRFSGLAIDRGRDPSEAIKLVSLYRGGANGNYGRVLPIGEGSVSYWGSAQGTLSHAPLDRYVRPLTFEKMKDECVVNGRSVSVWSARPTAEVARGEYALFLEPDRYHDFAIDDPEPVAADEAASAASAPK